MIFLRFLFLFVFFIGGLNGFAYAQSVAAEPVNLTSNSLFYDDLNKIVTAEGNVEILQAGKIIKADRVEYSVTQDKVFAIGNVSLTETNGDVYFAEKIELTDQMKNGTVTHFRTLMSDGSRFAAQSGQRVDGEKIIMRRARYTPCELCKYDPRKPPLWQLKAQKVQHDSVDKSITYNDATFELGGVPLLYTPYFSHPDGTEKQKAGFLAPTFSLSSDLGLGVNTQYYLPVDDTEDLTIGARVLTEQAPILLGEHRKRFDNAKIETTVSATYASRPDSESGNIIDTNKEFRGHLFSDGQLDINKHWRAGYKAQLTSDDQYLRQYDISSEDILENEIYAERFENRDYFVARTIAFQDVRVSNRADDQPNIIPEVKADFVGDPNETLGGRWSFNNSFLGLTRDGNGQDVIRGSSALNWQKRDIVYGAVNTLSSTIRADLYNVPQRDSDLLGAGGEGDSSSYRAVPFVHNVTSYPLVNRLERSEVLIEPTLAIKVSPNLKNNDDIPNEDSQDVQIDSNNIFNADRFPGLDRVEDRSNVTYGVRAGLFNDNGNYTDVFMGQSFRLDDKDNPFPKGSGLDEEFSSYVGQISSRYKDKLNLNYKFELENDTLSPIRHEVDAGLYWGRLALNTTYLYARALEGTDLLASREQIYSGLSYQIAPEWRAGATARYELSDTEDKGFRGGALSLDYLGQCLTFSTVVERSVTDKVSGEQALEVKLRIGLKNLGEFGVAQ